MILPEASHLEKRLRCFNGDCYNSTWDSWGHYVVIVAVIVVAIIIFFIIACMTARRRRSRGAQPYYGTGWMAGQHGAVNYYGNAAPPQQPSYYGNQQYGQAAPPYSANAPQPFYGVNRPEDNNIELQQPQGAYHSQMGGEPVYAPPSGPPPSKGDVIR